MNFLVVSGAFYFKTSQLHVYNTHLYVLYTLIHLYITYILPGHLYTLCPFLTTQSTRCFDFQATKIQQTNMLPFLP